MTWPVYGPKWLVVKLCLQWFVITDLEINYYYIIIPHYYAFIHNSSPCGIYKSLLPSLVTGYTFSTSTLHTACFSRSLLEGMSSECSSSSSPPPSVCSQGDQLPHGGLLHTQNGSLTILLSNGPWGAPPLGASEVVVFSDCIFLFPWYQELLPSNLFLCQYMICRPFLRFLDPEIAPFLQFLDPEIL